ncbi:MAG TPA: hypothetical protein VJ995_08520 [Geothermobacteraceae bacterium]|nr:hypothetical protein [Geothermobacteraceae bacterium]
MLAWDFGGKGTAATTTVSCGEDQLVQLVIAALALQTTPGCSNRDCRTASRQAGPRVAARVAVSGDWQWPSGGRTYCGGAASPQIFKV